MMAVVCRRKFATKFSLHYLAISSFLVISCSCVVVADEFAEHEIGAGENWIPIKRQVFAEAIEDEEEQEQDKQMEKAVEEVQLDATQKLVAEFNKTSTDYKFIIEIANEYYCERYGELHVLCAYKDTKPGIIYFDRGVSETEANFILRFIVRLRKRILQGQETGGNSGPLPKALRLKVLKWSEELQVFAQRIANQCKSSVNNSIIYATDRIPKLTISIAMSRDTIMKPRWTQALRHWYNEVENVKHDVVFHKASKMDNYAAMIWFSTGYVGCGYSSVKGKATGVVVKTYVCVFGPGGNIEGQKMYPTDLADYVETENATTTIEVPTTTAPQKMTRENPFSKVIFREEWDLG